jgi:hypothetical protein
MSLRVTSVGLCLVTAGCLITPMTPPCVDADGDGYGVGAHCEIEDCNDVDAGVNPAATERCDGLDNDCDGLVDDEDDSLVGELELLVDLDGDGFGDDDSEAMQACAAVEGRAAVGGDCDDADPFAYPGAAEYCDDILQDCERIIDWDCVLPPSLWITDGSEGIVHVIDTLRGELRWQVEAGSGAEALAVDQELGFAYLPVRDEGTVELIDPVALEVGHTWDLDWSCPDPTSIVAIREEDELHLLCDQAEILTIDSWSDSIFDRLSVSAERLYHFREHDPDVLFLLGAGSLARMQGPLTEPQHRVAVEGSLVALAHDPTRDLLLVSDRDVPAVHRYAASSLAWYDTLDGWERWASGLAYDAVRDVIYVTNGSDRVYRIDAETGAIEDAVDGLSTAGELVLDHAFETLWVLNGGDATVSRIELEGFEEVARFALGGEPTSLSILEPIPRIDEVECDSFARGGEVECSLRGYLLMEDGTLSIDGMDITSVSATSGRRGLDVTGTWRCDAELVEQDIVYQLHGYADRRDCGDVGVACAQTPDALAMGVLEVQSIEPSVASSGASIELVFFGCNLCDESDWSGVEMDRATLEEPSCSASADSVTVVASIEAATSAGEVLWCSVRRAQGADCADDTMTCIGECVSIR